MPELRRVGPYEIFDTLGSGGMGAAYLARDARLDRRVALKFITSDALSSPDTEAQLLPEARAASVLNHPNVCQVYDVGGQRRDVWIAMEYIDGTSLASQIRARGRLPAATVIRLGRAIAAALDHAHQRGILQLQ